MIAKIIKQKLSNRRIKRIEKDPFLKRIKSLIIGEGMLHEGNIYLMDFAIKQMPDKGHILEIGSYGGLSTNLMLHLSSKHGRNQKVVSCDPWIYEGYDDFKGVPSTTIDGREDVTRSDYSKYMKTAFISATKFLNKEQLPHSFQFTSDEFFKRYDAQTLEADVFGRNVLLDQAISFAYIDGNHAYEYAKRDFENVDKYLLKSGFILFDDSIDDSGFGSALFMDEMKKNPNYKLVDKNPNYLFEKLR